MIDICLLGCGGMVPLPNRRLTSLLFRNNGKMLLIDCGEGTQVPIKLSGWGYKSIEAICLTHYHADHVAGLPGLLLTIGNSGREEPITILGPPGLGKVVEALCAIAPILPFELKLVELSNENIETYRIGNIILKSFPVEHWLPCLAYSLEIKRAGKFDAKEAQNWHIPVEFWSRLQRGENIESQGEFYTPDMVLGKERQGLKISYCTDTRPIPGLTDFIKYSDLLICEGMYGEEDKLSKAIDKKHMLFSEAAKIALIGQVKELWLTHYSPSLDTPEKYIDNARNIFRNTNLGEDLKIKALKFED